MAEAKALSQRLRVRVPATHIFCLTASRKAPRSTLPQAKPKLTERAARVALSMLPCAEPARSRAPHTAAPISPPHITRHPAASSAPPNARTHSQQLLLSLPHPPHPHIASISPSLTHQSSHPLYVLRSVPRVFCPGCHGQHPTAYRRQVRQVSSISAPSVRVRQLDSRRASRVEPGSSVTLRQYARLPHSL